MNDGLKLYIVGQIAAVIVATMLLQGGCVDGLNACKVIDREIEELKALMSIEYPGPAPSQPYHEFNQFIAPVLHALDWDDLTPRLKEAYSKKPYPRKLPALLESLCDINMAVCPCRMDPDEVQVKETIVRKMEAFK